MNRRQSWPSKNSSELHPRPNGADVDVADIGIIIRIEREIAELEIHLRGVSIKILHDGNPERIAFIVIRRDIFRVPVIYTEGRIAETVQRGQPAELAPDVVRIIVLVVGCGCGRLSP